MKPANLSLIVICGPTGSGKSALGLALARHFQGEIVNYDSVQVYRGLDIGSAKTPLADRAGIPHHLLDVISPLGELTAGSYATLARACLSEISSRGVIPILVGGTGFYLRSLLEGLSPAPARHADLRSRLAQLSLRRPAALHRYLRRAAPSAASRIHANDHQKLIRAIELAAAPPPAPRQPLTGYKILKLGLNPARETLYEALNHRSATLFENGGILAETEALLQSGVPPQAKSLQSLGYKQALAVLQGEMILSDAITEVQSKTRQYAKRQMTWFRRESNIHWFAGFGNEEGTEKAALDHVRTNL